MMDINKLANNIILLEGAKEGGKQVAEYLFIYYHELINKGFDKEQAIYLTQEMQKIFFSGEFANE